MFGERTTSTVYPDRTLTGTAITVKARQKMSNRKRNSHGSTPGPPSRRPRKKPLDHTQLWVAAIAACAAIIVAAIGAVNMFVGGRAHLPEQTPTPSATIPPRPITPTASGAASPTGNATTLYLANQTGTTPDSYAPPVPGKRSLSGTAYSQSIGYPGLCEPGKVTYALNGAYKYFIATVGVADGADPSDQSTTVYFKVYDGSGNVISYGGAQYGKPQAIKVPVQGISSLTLKTSIGVGGCFSIPSVAIWGNARLVGF
jgi:hypothetical protein